MGISKTIKRWWQSLWQKEAQDKFNVETIESDVMEAALQDWVNIYQGKPAWAQPDYNGNVDIESFNFAKKLCNETARLTTLALGISIEGSERADYLNGFMESYISKMKNEECEKTCAFGYIILKPNGNGIDYVMPWDFCPTHEEDGKIDGGIFFDHYHEQGDKWYYTRLEYHRFELQMPETDRTYRITNKTYRSNGKTGIGQEVDIKKTVWKDMQDDVAISNLDNPLFSVFKMPVANNIDIGSPLGVSIFSNATKELKSLDIAWTRLEDEIFDSQKVTFLGDMMLEGADGRKVSSRIAPGGAVDKMGRPLPRHVRILPGSTTGEEYHESNPTMQTAHRLSGIDHYLNLVGVKVGYSTGQFVLNGRTGHVTATQVEADDRATIQFIKQIRDSFQTATDGLLYALDKCADLYNLAPVGAYEVNYDFGDITYNWEEDRIRHWQYVQSGKYPLWRYYVKFEGMSEEEAKEVVSEAKTENQPEENGLFNEE